MKCPLFLFTVDSAVLALKQLVIDSIRFFCFHLQVTDDDMEKANEQRELAVSAFNEGTASLYGRFFTVLWLICHVANRCLRFCREL